MFVLSVMLSQDSWLNRYRMALLDCRTSPHTYTQARVGEALQGAAPHVPLALPLGFTRFQPATANVSTSSALDEEVEVLEV